MKKFVIGILTLVVFLSFLLLVKADEIDDINNAINSLKKDLSGKEVDYQSLNTRLNEIKNRIGGLEQEISKKEIEVKKGEQVLSYQKELLNERVKSYYKNINNSSTLFLSFLVADDLSTSLRKIFYQKSIVDEDKNTIIKIVLYVKNLEEIKKQLEIEKSGLARSKIDVDKQSQIIAGQISQTRSKIAELTARQQQLIAQKLASLNISRSSSSPGRCDSDLTNGRDPGFSPRFAFFTFGVPNRVGMNQYGAWGRSKAGQSYETILRAYYNFEEIKDFDENIQIRVDGHNSYKLDDYVKRVYEVPNSWGDDGGMEALKAQAIAARSYALAYTNNGSGSICDSENCQVFQDGEKGGNWSVAVDATKNKAMVQGGNPIKAWFSSTHGGYIFSSGEIGWSNTDWTKHANDFDGSVGSFSDLASRAYDRESPWFYCDWGSRSQYNKTAWLKSEELADIVNTILLAKVDSSVREHLYQPDNPPAGTDNWGPDRVRQELGKHGQKAFNSISSGSVSADFSSGRVNQVSFSGDAGDISFSLSEFKDWFNLRAPANIQIVGPLFNIEKR
ncbi:MAG: SpoIID/LytB domain-containing protein [Patescibacteria group bacterium]|jgi:SpoIID/LytB domain protein